jgi:hypothetical protein
LLALFAIGCGEKGPDPKVEANRLEGAKTMRTLFDKVGGDYTKLTPEDKAVLLKQFNNDEANARRMWELMVSRGQGQSAVGSPSMPGGN